MSELALAADLMALGEVAMDQSSAAEIAIESALFRESAFSDEKFNSIDGFPLASRNERLPLPITITRGGQPSRLVRAMFSSISRLSSHRKHP